MGLHNLESVSLLDIVSEFASEADKSQAHGWIDDLMNSYASAPTAPYSTEVEVAAHMLKTLRGLYFNLFYRKAQRQADILNAVIQKNASQRLAIFIEWVDSPSMDDTLSRYTVWKGVLFETRLTETVVCWHPDKDFKPVDATRAYRTGYSELGRRQRRKQVRNQGK
ncbi:MAG: hypothetical protein KDE08_15200 [Rhodobacteraceae bacterium]|nr:hypothetical protein [Paracoccaceae bacterium]